MPSSDFGSKHAASDVEKHEATKTEMFDADDKLEKDVLNSEVFDRTNSLLTATDAIQTRLNNIRS
jgi:hypothetical protein